MAIAHDADSTGSLYSTSATITLSHTIGSGVNRLLVVHLVGIATTWSRWVLDSFTYGGVPLTLIGTAAPTGTVRIFTYVLVAPATGTDDIELQWSESGGASGFSGLIMATSYTGVQQSAPTEAYDEDSDAASNPISLDITPTKDNSWIHLAVWASDTSITADFTGRNNTAIVTHSVANEDTGPISPPALTSMTYSDYSGVVWIAGGFAMIPEPDPIPGAFSIGFPMNLFASQLDVYYRGRSNAAAPVLPVPDSQAGVAKTFLRRDPKVDRREGRNWEILVDMINSLLRRGHIYPRRDNADTEPYWVIDAEGLLDTSGLTGTFEDSSP